MKLCRVCRKQKAYEEFYKSSRNKDGYFGECKECNREKCRAYRARPDIKIRSKGGRREYLTRYRLTKIYGITLEKKREMWIEQKGRCAICNKRMVKSKECNIDHDHITGEVRKLLCNKCNHYLSAIEDKKFDRIAHDYLKQYEV